MMDFLVFMKEWGLPGVIIALLLMALYLKDRQLQQKQKEYELASQERQKGHDQALKELNRELQEEARLRVSDTKEFTNTALSLHDEITNSVNTISRAQEENVRLCQVVDNFTRTVERLIAKRGGD